MHFPIIKILALLGIFGGLATLAWYVELSREEQQKADRLALQWFGRRFKELEEYQQNKVWHYLN